MLTFGSNPIFLYDGPVDMRKSFDGLSVLVHQAFPDRHLGGAFFVFVNRRQNHVKVLTWDGDGLVVWHKRLERGTFRISEAAAGLMSRREFTMLLEGISPKRLNKRFAVKLE